ncbi:MAG: hypothetical protein Q7S45_04500 [Candidatus Curtissbacteria bacterium]|nr:hypothetical protein [Candidatus Curtissbacteria bacterium]
MKTKFYPAIIFTIILAFFLPFIFRPELLTIRDNDLGRTYIPLFSFFKDSIGLNRQFPLWRPSQMMGETLIGNPLWSPIYPLNVIFVLLPTGLGSIIYLLFHFELAGLSTYFLGRSFRLSSIASASAAFFYAFSVKMLLHLSAGHVTMIAAASFIPMAFLSVRQLIIKPSFSWTVAGSISLAAMYITYPTIFYYTIIFLAIYYLYKYPPKLIKNFDVLKSAKYFWPFIILMFVTLGLAAAAILPQLEFAPFSTRSSLGFSDVAQPLWNLKRFATSLFFPYLKFSSFDHESFLYLGVVPTLLAAFGFMHLPKTRKITVGLFGLLTAAFAAGASTPVFRLAYEFLPVLKYSRITTRPWFIVALIVALLAAFGISKIKSKLIIFLLLIFFLAENLFIGYKKILSIPNLSFSNESFYQYLANDRDIFRVYCTTYCFNPQLLAKYNIKILAGETPIQEKSVVDFLEKAGNYKYQHFAVIFPPYQVWQVPNPPQPNPSLLAQANVKYVASTYKLGDENFKFVGQFQNILLYINRFKSERALIDISYHPKSFITGLIVSALTILALILWYIRTRKFPK